MAGPGLPSCLGRHTGVVASVLGSLRCIAAAVGFAVGVTLLGAVGLCALEGGAEVRAVQRTVVMQEKLRSELSEQTYQELVDGGWWAELTGDEELSWSMSNWKQPVLFAFTLSSTVGYGNSDLRTNGGRAFATLFSVVAIPVTIAVSVFVAAQITSSVQVVLLSITHPSGETFHKYDVDGNGTLEKAELGAALRDMGLPNVTERIADLIIRHLQPNGDRLTYAQFCHAVSVLLPPKVEEQHRRAHLHSAVVACLAWLAIGSAIFAHCEGWGLGVAMWYAWITLTTIGLGDFVPSTPGGQLVAVLWGTAGLGLLAMLMSAISDKIAEAMRLEDPGDGEEPSDRELCEMRVRHLLQQSSGFLALSGRSEPSVWGLPLLGGHRPGVVGRPSAGRILRRTSTCPSQRALEAMQVTDSLLTNSLLTKRGDPR